MSSPSNSSELTPPCPSTDEFLGDGKPINGIAPFVSVVVTAYQHGSFIKECMNSILAQQTDFPFEIIVGEDESTDGTRETCISYAKAHPDRIRLFLRSRTTSVRIMNANTTYLNGRWCRLASRGKYVAFCEGDDFWTDTRKLQKQVELLERRPDVTLCGHRVLMGRSRDTHPLKLMPAQERPLTNSLRDVVKEENWIPTCSMMVKTEIAQMDPAWRKGLAFGDWPLQVTAAQFGNIAFLNKVMGFYRVHSGGIWSSVSKTRKYEDTIRFYDALKDQVPEDCWKVVQRKRAELKLKLSTELSAMDQHSRAMSVFWKAILETPPVAFTQPRLAISSLLKAHRLMRATPRDKSLTGN